MSLIVVLHNVRSLHNVGSIFRTADGAGVRKLYLTGVTPSPVDQFGNYRPQFAKVALGAERTMLWEKKQSLPHVLRSLRKEGYTIFAVEQSKKSIPYHTLPKSYLLSSKFCLLFGNEVRGLSSRILERADTILEIPMRGAVVRDTHHPRRAGKGKESLNVSVAAGIIIFHFTLRKRKITKAKRSS